MITISNSPVYIHLLYQRKHDNEPTISRRCVNDNENCDSLEGQKVSESITRNFELNITAF